VQAGLNTAIVLDSVVHELVDIRFLDELLSLELGQLKVTARVWVEAERCLSRDSIKSILD